MGALLETFDWEPAFPQPDEPPRDALRRVRPSVVLADWAMGEVWSSAFLGPARMLEVPVIAFGGLAAAAQVERLATAQSVPCIIFPADPASFRALLDRVARGRDAAPGR